ncbi:uroporphyrinogen-III synthase [Sphingobium sp. B1D7B]|uniref:uroporphyrinogen-III synthase n=1 Tax=unclassified Sphingobium TaxID=2611147 RepID=UPI0022254356|nr:MULTISPECIES: uroporphyrinogen-III synthase [unclassified Sphingobium]MCW2392890.1 uroporphyrinogen-III synthase [Sphingobium sp. B11D3A]MCW2404692.1 uroporphyrinogen-III synthase [Sphingobium sp. B1D7B]
MNRPYLILRPQPGSDASAAKAAALGLEVVQLPLFEVVAVHEEPLPQGPFDALLITSANGARYGGEALACFPDLPVYVVGEASADAVREAGHPDVIIGGGDAASTVPMIVGAGHRRILHVCGEETRPFDPLDLSITRHICYRTEARDMRRYTKMLVTMPPSVIAVHSPAAGRRLNALMPPACRNHFLIAISQAAADATGSGWRRVSVAQEPNDSALLRLATSLCIGAS